ncbi:hypothetical protein CYMTET_55178 [Cymbomonas tetramitiformis]|uniref:Uncharacterized protein n=1 Tax=Cymbomonas tetramitiformis TaxID=36881 RepID=A0AAE0BDK4_9CHLO|nr:hypothetical protein CYMTET_55178 [Cymbomonas tetramitiformis]|eukprot:gene115-166_t
MCDTNEFVADDAPSCGQPASEDPRPSIRVIMRIWLRKEGASGVAVVSEREHQISADPLPNAIVVGREPHLIEKDFSWTAPELRPLNVAGIKRAWHACKSTAECTDATVAKSTEPVYHVVKLKSCADVGDHELSRLCSRVQFLVRPRLTKLGVVRDRTSGDHGWEIMNVSVGIDMIKESLYQGEPICIHRFGELVGRFRDDWTSLQHKNEDAYVLLNTELLRTEAAVDHVTRQFVESSERIEIRFEMCDLTKWDDCVPSEASNKRVRFATSAAEA